MSLTIKEHLLQKVSEECVEVSKEISKALLFGLEDVEPKGINTNREKIQNELADLLGVVELLTDKGILNKSEIFHKNKISIKKLKVLDWMKYSIDKGITIA